MLPRLLPAPPPTTAEVRVCRRGVREEEGEAGPADEEGISRDVVLVLLGERDGRVEVE